MGLSKNIDKKNKEILNYLNQKKYYFTHLNQIDKALGYSDGYMSKIANEEDTRKLTKIQTIALEYIFKIPSSLFFNEKIINKQDIENEIERNKYKYSLFVENKAPESLEEFKKFKYLYIMDKRHNEVVKRVIIIKDQYIEILNKDYKEKDKVNFKGFIHTSCNSLVMITENPTTGNSAIFKVQRNSLIGDIIPIVYLGHRTNSNEEVVGYGICSKNEIEDSDVKTIIDIDKNIDFSEQKLKVIDNIINYAHRKDELFWGSICSMGIMCLQSSDNKKKK